MGQETVACESMAVTDHAVVASTSSTPPVGQIWRTYYYAGGQRLATTDVLTYLHPSTAFRAGSDHPALHSGQA